MAVVPTVASSLNEHEPANNQGLHQDSVQSTAMKSQQAKGAYRTNAFVLAAYFVVLDGQVAK